MTTPNQRNEKRINSNAMEGHSSSNRKSDRFRSGLSGAQSLHGMHPTSRGTSSDSAGTRSAASPPRTLVSVGGQTFIPPNSSFAKAVVAGRPVASTKETSSPHAKATTNKGERPHHSNLTILLSKQPQQLVQQKSSDQLLSSSLVDEADSASGPSPLNSTTLAKTFDDSTMTKTEQEPRGETTNPLPLHTLVPTNGNVRRYVASNSGFCFLFVCLLTTFHKMHVQQRVWHISTVDRFSLYINAAQNGRDKILNESALFGIKTSRIWV